MTVVGSNLTFANNVRSNNASELNNLDFGYLAWNFPLWAVGGSQTVSTAGTVRVMKIYIPVATTITTITMWSINTSGAGVGLTSGQNFAGLFNSSKTLLSATADQTTLWGTSGKYDMNLTTPQSVTPGYYYVGIFWNGTTSPTWVRMPQNYTGLANGKQSGANSLCANADTGRTTSFPSTLGTLTATDNMYWVGLS